MEVRVSHYKNKDKATWPEYASRPAVHMTPTLGTVVERGAPGGPTIMLSALTPSMGNMVIFKLDEIDLDLINKTLADAKKAWAKAAIKIVKS